VSLLEGRDVPTKRQQRERDDQKSTDVTQGTLLALLGFLIACTYAFALDRHSFRKAAVLLEANALSTAYLRADLLEEPERQRLQSALRDYARIRVRLPHKHVVSTEANEAAIERAEAAQAPIWPAALRSAETRLHRWQACLSPQQMNLPTPTRSMLRPCATKCQGRSCSSLWRLPVARRRPHADAVRFIHVSGLLASR
jgi:hypothetical protein